MSDYLRVLCLSLMQQTEPVATSIPSTEPERMMVEIPPTEGLVPTMPCDDTCARGAEAVRPVKHKSELMVMKR